MTTRDDIDLGVRTDRDLNTEEFARAFMDGLLRLQGGRMAPEYFNLWEPINRSLAKEGIETAVRLWSEPNRLGGIFYLRRRSSPQLTVQVIKGFPLGYPDERFPWGCGAWTTGLREEVGAAELFDLMVTHFSPAFGKCTRWSDVHMKHRFAIDYGRGIREFSMGTTPNGKLIPGIYWLTFLGPWAIEKLGKERVESLPLGKVKRIGDGYLIKAYPHVKQAGTADAREAEEAIMSHFGRHLFFDRSQVDVDKIRQELIDGTFDEPRASPDQV